MATKPETKGNRKYDSVVFGVGGEPWDAGVYQVQVKEVKFMPAKDDKASKYVYKLEVVEAEEANEKHVGRTFNEFFSNTPKGDYFGMQRHMGFLICLGLESENSYLDFEEEDVKDRVLTATVGESCYARIEPDGNNPKWAKVVEFMETAPNAT